MSPGPARLLIGGEHFQDFRRPRRQCLLISVITQVERAERGQAGKGFHVRTGISCEERGGWRFGCDADILIDANVVGIDSGAEHE